MENRRFGGGWVTVKTIAGDGNCLLRSLYHQRFRSSWDFAEDKVAQRIIEDRAALHAYISDRFGEFYNQLAMNGVETRKDKAEDQHTGAMRALAEMLKSGTYCGEEVIKAYADINKVTIEVYHVAGNVIVYEPAGGAAALTSLRIYFNDRIKHYESVMPQVFETQQERDRVKNSKRTSKPSTEAEKKKTRLRKRKFEERRRASKKAKIEPKKDESEGVLCRCAFHLHI